MGEAVYYLRARWPDAKSAEEAYPAVGAFLEQMRELQDARDRLSVPELWEKYGDVLCGLGLEPQDFGVLSIIRGSGEVNPPSADDTSRSLCILNETDICFAGTISHLASWDGLRTAMRELGAVSAGWLSEEDLTDDDFYSLVKLS